MSASANRYIFTETLIASVFSFAFNYGISWLALQGLNPITLFGVPGLGLGFVPATFMTVLMVAVISTLITRSRRRARKAPELPARATRLPRHVLLRGLLVAVLATIVFAPSIVAALHFAYPGPYSLMWSLAGNGVYGIILAVVVAPPILRAALSEPAPAPTSKP
jgi:hypothetical protein